MEQFLQEMIQQETAEKAYNELSAYLKEDKVAYGVLREY